MSEAEIFLPRQAGGWGVAGAKVRLPRPTNCANAPCVWRWHSISPPGRKFKPAGGENRGLAAQDSGAVLKAVYGRC